MGGWVDVWMGGWVDVWMGGWVDGWMCGWVDRCTRLKLTLNENVNARALTYILAKIVRFATALPPPANTPTCLAKIVRFASLERNECHQAPWAKN